MIHDARARIARMMRVRLGIILAVLLATYMEWGSEVSASVKVTLLGTGGPEFFVDRLGIATLVEANGQYLLFDVGRGRRRISI